VLGASWAAILALEVWGGFDESFIWLVGIAFGWAGGFAVQTQFRLIAETKASQATLAARAVAEERARIAREIHDVVAHTLSVTMLHLTGARLALERGDRADATAALLEAERAGRASMADIRRTVGLLAGDGASGTDEPMPTAVDLPELVGGFRAAGLDVELQLRGDPTRIPDAAGLAVYRIAQESLANVVRHAPGAAATVCLDVDGEVIRMEVADSGNGSAGPVGEGRGVAGMKERAELLGGSVRAGRGDRGWIIEATLPGPDARAKRRCG
ncbi:MAG: sensor histidine kinase, partial [Acidimicrobiia bacterium]